MNLKVVYIKTFKRHKCVIVKVINESGRITSHWAIPSPENTVKLNETMDAIVLHKDARLLSTKRNIPTYIVHYKDCIPLTLENLKREGVYSTNELRMILDNDLAEKVFKAGNKGRFSDEAKMLVMVIIVAVLALGYYLNMRIVELVPEPDPNPVVEEVV